MTDPKLSVASSGYGGRGYKQIFGDGTVVPSLTTAIGALDKPGLVHWHVEQTALFAVTHLDDLLNRTEEAGVRYLQYFSRRKFDQEDPGLNVFNAAEHVLDDLSDTGVWIHQYIEDDLNGFITEDPVRDDHYQMVEAWHGWKDRHDIEVIATESTVFGDGWAGTADLFAVIDGVTTCLDVKSSRKVHSSHIAQVATLGTALSRAVEVSEGTEGAVHHKLTPAMAKQHGGQVDTWWVEESIPDFSQYGILQVRPMDFDRTTGEVIEPFAKFTVIPQAQIEAGHKLFKAGLAARMAERELKEAGFES